MDIHNAHPGHIGLQTTDNNVDHTRWPCVSHPPTVRCDEAVKTASRKGFRSLVPQTSVPAREWVPK